MAIKTVHDKERGCGWRKPGGLYLRSDGLLAECGRLPLVLERCPCCGAGVKPTRGWTWVNPRLLFKDRPCSQARERCMLCRLNDAALPERAGLLWIGGQFYKRPDDWISEVRSQGVSRRIHALPKGFEVGKTLVLAAHRQDHLANDQRTWVPAVFHAFVPTAVEYVVKGTETESQLQLMEKRGITPVKVIRDGMLGDLDEQAGAQPKPKLVPAVPMPELDVKSKRRQRQQRGRAKAKKETVL